MRPYATPLQRRLGPRLLRSLPRSWRQRRASSAPRRRVVNDAVAEAQAEPRLSWHACCATRPDTTIVGSLVGLRSLPWRRRGEGQTALQVHACASSSPVRARGAAPGAAVSRRHHACGRKRSCSVSHIRTHVRLRPRWRRWRPTWGLRRGARTLRPVGLGAKSPGRAQ